MGTSARRPGSFRAVRWSAPVAGAWLAAVAAGCGTEIDAPASNEAPASVSVTHAALAAEKPEGPADEYLRTPVGRFHKSCIHELPAGAELDATGAVRHEGRALGRLEECRFKSFRTRRGPGAPSGVAADAKTLVPQIDGWVERAYAFAPLTPAGYRWYNLMYSSTFVPAAPASSGALVYLFSDFLSITGNEIIQPVLQYGSNGSMGGNYWGIATWYVDEFDHAVHSAFVRVSQGDRIDGQMIALPNKCSSAGVCTWRLAMNRNGTYATSINVAVGEAMALADKGALEVYNLTSCPQFPNQTGTYFFNTYVDQPVNSLGDYTDVTNSLYWASNVFNRSPSCSYYVSMPNTRTAVLGFTP
jgi:hypothetical protein